MGRPVSLDSLVPPGPAPQQCDSGSSSPGSAGDTARAPQMERGALQMLVTVKPVFILLFLFLMRRGRVVTSPQSGVCVHVRVRQREAWAAQWRVGAADVTFQTGEDAPRPSVAGKLQGWAHPSAFSSLLCRQAFQMGLNERETQNTLWQR